MQRRIQGSDDDGEERPSRSVDLRSMKLLVVIRWSEALLSDDDVAKEFCPN